MDGIGVSLPDVYPSLRQCRPAFLRRVSLPYDTWREENEQLITVVLLLLPAEEPANDWQVRQAWDASPVRLDGAPIEATDHDRIAILD